VQVPRGVDLGPQYPRKLRVGQVLQQRVVGFGGFRIELVAAA